MKLTEKCGLSSAGSSPVVPPLCTPEDLKSNILKAQVEAAALKVGNGSARRSSHLQPWHSATRGFCVAAELNPSCQRCAEHP